MQGFRYAYDGLKYALMSQRNMRFHVFAAIVMLSLGLFLAIPRADFMLLFVAITLVIITELINTAIENTTDLAMPQRHPKAKIAKDTAAAAVLVSALFALVVAILVFYPAFDRWVSQVPETEGETPVWTAAALLGTVSLLILSIQAFARGNRHAWRPSLFAGLAFAAAVWVVIRTSDPVMILFTLFSAGLVALVMYEKKQRSGWSVISGALLGGTLAFCLHVLTTMVWPS